MFGTYRGGCHCGALRFEVDLDVSAGTTKCNCTLCRKMRLWAISVNTEAFRLIAGKTDMTDYRGSNQVAHHVFCKHCGVRPFEWVDMPNLSGHKYYNINVACLDDVDIDELVAAPVTYCDGLNNAWEATPAETRHL